MAIFWSNPHWLNRKLLHIWIEKSSGLYCSYFYRSTQDRIEHPNVNVTVLSTDLTWIWWSRRAPRAPQRPSPVTRVASNRCWRRARRRTVIESVSKPPSCVLGPEPPVLMLYTQTTARLVWVLCLLSLKIRKVSWNHFY